MLTSTMKRLRHGTLYLLGDICLVDGGLDHLDRAGDPAHPLHTRRSVTVTAREYLHAGVAAPTAEHLPQLVGCQNLAGRQCLRTGHALECHSAQHAVPEADGVQQDPGYVRCDDGHQQIGQHRMCFPQY
jgi:hypothetical protein